MAGKTTKRDSLTQAFSGMSKDAIEELLSQSPAFEDRSPEELYAEFQVARTEERKAKARLKQLELAKIQGEMFDKDTIEADAAAVAAEMRSALFSMAARVAVVCEGRNAREIQRIIEDEVSTTLEIFQKSEFIK